MILFFLQIVQRQSVMQALRFAESNPSLEIELAEEVRCRSRYMDAPQNMHYLIARVITPVTKIASGTVICILGSLNIPVTTIQ